MNEHDAQLDALLDRWKIAPMTGDLTAAVLARAAAEDDALDALLDRTRSQPTAPADLAERILQRARREDLELDRVLAVAEVPPLTGNLAGRVLGRVRRTRLIRRVAALAGSLAAAAAIAVVVLIAQSGEPTGPVAGGDNPKPPTGAQVKLNAQDEQVVSNLDLVRDFYVLKHWETIREMEQLEGEAPANSL